MKIKLFLVFFLLTIDVIFSQCSMCRAVAESGGAEKEGFFEGLNSGILYLMVTPYILLTIGAIFFYLSKKKI